MRSEPGAAPDLRPRLRTSMRGWIERHALIVFFALAYALSWTIWLTKPLIERYEPVGSEWYSPLALFGPTLAALILSALLGEGRAAPTPLAPRLAITALALVIGLGTNWFLLDSIAFSPHPPVAMGFWLLLTLLPVLIVWLAGTRLGGLRKLLGSLWHWRHEYNHYLLALLLAPVAGLSGIIVLRLLGEPWPQFPLAKTPINPFQLGFIFISSILYDGSLGEEPGWRGFALPRLQERFDPLTASAILSIVWSIWYVPPQLLVTSMSGLPMSHGLITGMALRLLSILPIMIMYTWMYNRSGGNLLLLVIMHASVSNTLGWWLPTTAGFYLGLYALVPVLVVLDRMWRRR